MKSVSGDKHVTPFWCGSGRPEPLSLQNLFPGRRAPPQLPRRLSPRRPRAGSALRPELWPGRPRSERVPGRRCRSASVTTPGPWGEGRADTCGPRPRGGKGSPPSPWGAAAPPLPPGVRGPRGEHGPAFSCRGAGEPGSRGFGRRPCRGAGELAILRGGGAAAMRGGTRVRRGAAGQGGRRSEAASGQWRLRRRPERAQRRN